MATDDGKGGMARKYKEINALKSSLKQLQVQFDNQRILLQQKDEAMRKEKAEFRRIQAEARRDRFAI